MANGTVAVDVRLPANVDKAMRSIAKAAGVSPASVVKIALAQRLAEMGMLQPKAKPELWQHKKTGGMYEVICNANLESDPDTLMVVYRSVRTGERWVRPAAEFNDGRFERAV